MPPKTTKPAADATETGVTPTTEATDGTPEVTGPKPAWTVKCVRPQGIWRAGQFWPNEEVLVDEDDLTPEALAALEAEPLLIVKEVKE